MYIAKTKKEFLEYFKAEFLPEIKKQENEFQPGIDRPMRREAWNNLIDSYLRDRMLPRIAENWCCPW